MATQIRSQIFEVLPSALTLKVLFSSYVGAVWLSLIWAVMPNLTGGPVRDNGGHRCWGYHHVTHWVGARVRIDEEFRC